ncbi:hypothetical protein [Burkholderia cepacia]|uniref:hypothetical protein n=1 Tax=Burkholderia cepacia TaxID=292 RepID=UPI002AB6D673|nr:hypothetical protein [Burkholderia cepacia]
MSDINAAPSSTEPSNEAAKTDMQEAGAAAVGESQGSGVDLSTQTSSNANSISTFEQSIADRSLDSSASASLSPESQSPLGDSSASGDDPNAGASPAAGQSASGTASSAPDASQGADIAADVSLGEPSTAHNWLSLLERKLAVLDHEGRDELLDVARQLREAL